VAHMLVDKILENSLTVVRVVPANERMNRLEFSSQVEWTEHVVHIGQYQCPWCSDYVEFRTQNFQKHEHITYSNLKSPWPKRFSNTRPIKAEKWESFLDFHCPGCAAPVRIIYEPGNEYAMGTHGWRVTEIIETNKWSHNEA
jgi:hypothetical protein